MTSSLSNKLISEPLFSSINIRLKRVDRTFRPNEVIEGFISVSAKDGWNAKGINMAVDGCIHLSTRFCCNLLLLNFPCIFLF